MKQTSDKNMNDSNVGLAYKDHSSFFEKFYDKRDKLLASISNLPFSENKNDYIESFGLLKYMINNTTTYLYKYNKQIEKTEKEIEIEEKELELKNKSNQSKEEIEKTEKEIEKFKFINGKEYIDGELKSLIDLVNKKEYKKFIVKIEELLEFINSCLSKEEILPLNQEYDDETEKFWKEEPKKAWREAKKAFTDIMKNMGV